MERIRAQLAERLDGLDRKSSGGLAEICLPSTLNVKQVIETDRSHDTKLHNRFKTFVVNAFSDGTNDSLEKVCLGIANKVKKEIHVKAKPKRPVLCAIIAKSAYSLDAKSRDLYGAYYEYELKGTHIIAVKLCSTEDTAKARET